ncbi:protein transporter tim10 [Apophysomyces ossiformis]|uniref:Mitochondrial import inner membrane translocase subunit n=1 Tax=Apophysomyces ossiformis TaxID=679940 RepID=A0A8H7BQK1_9FUNG|nr:protein transporter tim10 [Apophysomyces ossiformis]
MSMWSSYSQTYVNPDNLILAEQQVDQFMQLYNRILETCRNKCIPIKYHEGDLNKGEMMCIDRCVAKYGAIQKHLSDKLEKSPLNPAQNTTNNNDFSDNTL